MEVEQFLASGFHDGFQGVVKSPLHIKVSPCVESLPASLFFLTSDALLFKGHRLGNFHQVGMDVFVHTL